MPQRRLRLEVCVDSLQGAVAACRAGADRIELNAALQLGGLTPSIGMVEQVVSECSCEVVAMLRPRAGGFCYTASELSVMRRDAERLCQAGVNGIAFGVLTADRRINTEACRAIVDACDRVQLVFHRAFDVLADRPSQLNLLVDLGFQRVLTSGGKETALAGAAELAALHRQSAGRISIMPGGGVRADNLVELYTKTGCLDYHGSFSAHDCDPADPVASSDYLRTDAAAVVAARRALDDILGSK